MALPVLPVQVVFNNWVCGLFESSGSSAYISTIDEHDYQALGGGGQAPAEARFNLIGYNVTEALLFVVHFSIYVV